MVDRKKLVYRTNEYTNSFKNFRTINTFGRNVYNSTITLKEVDKNQSSLSDEIMNSKSKIKPQNPEKKQIKKDILRNLYAEKDFLMVEKEFLILLKAEYF